MVEKSVLRYLLVVALLAFFVTSAVATQTAGGRKTKAASPACDDATVAAKVKAALAKDPLLDGQYIIVDVKDGAVTLTGFACTGLRKTQATSDANKVKCVKTVANNLKLGASPAKCAGATPCCCCNDQGICECQGRAGGRCCIQPRKK